MTFQIRCMLHLHFSVTSRYTEKNLAAIGYTHSYACPDLPSGMRGKGTALLGNSGLIILSKTPILRGAYHRFNKQAAFEFHCVDRVRLMGCRLFFIPHSCVACFFWG